MVVVGTTKDAQLCMQGCGDMKEQGSMKPVKNKIVSQIGL